MQFSSFYSPTAGLTSLGRKARHIYQFLLVKLSEYWLFLLLTLWNVGSALGTRSPCWEITQEYLLLLPNVIWLSIDQTFPIPSSCHFLSSRFFLFFQIFKVHSTPLLSVATLLGKSRVRSLENRMRSDCSMRVPLQRRFSRSLLSTWFNCEAEVVSNEDKSKWNRTKTKAQLIAILGCSREKKQYRGLRASWVETMNERAENR